jgi:6-phosphogluconolactonase
MKVSKLIFFLLICSNAFCQKTYLFVGSYNLDKNKSGIYIYSLDTISGKLKFLSSTKNILNPSYLTISNNGKFVYSCTDTKTPNAGSVSSFKFDKKDASLTYINSQPSGGDNPVYLTLDHSQKWLVVGNYSGGSLSVFPLDLEGHILPIKQNFKYTDGSINKERQESSHIHSTVFSPDYKFLFAPDLGSDKIRCYKFDSLKKEPLQEAKNPFVKTTLGSGPRHFAFHRNKKYAYCIEELSGTISAYKYNKGNLKKIQRIETHAKEINENFSSADIHVSPDGHFVYASNRGNENNIALFSIAKNGKLATIGYESTSGKTPRNFTIDTNGQFLIVGNQTTGEIVVFERNLKTGLLKKIENDIKVDNPSCVKILKI